MGYSHLGPPMPGLSGTRGLPGVANPGLALYAGRQPTGFQPIPHHGARSHHGARALSQSASPRSRSSSATSRSSSAIRFASASFCTSGDRIRAQYSGVPNCNAGPWHSAPSRCQVASTSPLTTTLTGFSFPTVFTTPVSGPDLTRNWPAGWKLASLDPEQLYVGINIYLMKATYEYVWTYEF